MSGEPDRQYVVARSVLLDALDALGAQRGAVILVCDTVHGCAQGIADIAAFWIEQSPLRFD